MAKKKWKKDTLKLKKDHLWKAKPGYTIFVADRGAVRFDIPQGWIVEPGPDSTKFIMEKLPTMTVGWSVLIYVCLQSTGVAFPCPS